MTNHVVAFSFDSGASPATITTNCRPLVDETYFIGVACDPTGKRAFHSHWPRVISIKRWRDCKALATVFHAMNIDALDGRGMENVAARKL
jgi:hypothetical protein